ncbi:MAG: transketolase [Planctomycetes bacterium]|nr:transketolase [Planctomycetota bacterium]
MRAADTVEARYRTCARRGARSLTAPPPSVILSPLRGRRRPVRPRPPHTTQEAPVAELAAETLTLLAARAARLRADSIRATTAAGSGHPTTCLSAADLASVLFFHELRCEPQHPENPANDRVIFSKGHAAPLLYAAWAQLGAIPYEKLLTLRRFDSELEGHPTPRFRWSDAATGSLGQGLSVGAGMALAGKRLLAAPYRVYVLTGDGELAEGSIWEAVAFAAQHGLDNLVALLDINAQGQSQRTHYGHDTAAYARRFTAFGWNALEVDGHDLAAIGRAFATARATGGRPTAIVARTNKGHGISFLADKDGWHGKPLSKEDHGRALAELPQEAAGAALHRPPAPAAFAPPALARSGPPIAPDYAKGAQVATREAYGKALVKVGAADPRVVALDGDTKNSTFSDQFLKAFPARFTECFIAEQNMIGVAVGLAARGFVPFASTFGTFLSRAFDQLRMGAIGEANIKLAGSHCGVSIGEDGSSQMGLEDLAMFRTLPGAAVLYPGDAVACERLVDEAARYRGIAYLRLNRPKTPVLYGAEERFPIGGCKVHGAAPGDRLTVVGAGVTLHEALKAQAALAAEGVAVRVVDLYSVKPLDRATLSACAAATGGLVLTVADHYPAGGIGEAVAAELAPLGVRVVGLAVREMPHSGKPEELLEAYGISAGRIAVKVRELVGSGR